MAKNSFVAEVTFKKRNIKSKVISPPQLYLHDETVLLVLFHWEFVVVKSWVFLGKEKFVDEVGE